MTTKTKGAYGSGALKKRANGTFECRIWVEQPNGDKQRRAFYGKSQREALQKAKEFRDALARGTGSAGRQQTVAAFLESWLETARLELKPSTAIRYAELVNRHLIPGLGGKRLDRLTTQDVQTFLNGKNACGELKPRTIHHLRAVLHTALNYAVQDLRLLSYNAAAGTKSPRVPHREPNFLSQEQAGAFLAAAQADELGALFTVALVTGARQGEVLGLKWADIDLDHNALHIRRTVRRMRVVAGAPTELKASGPKTASSLRTVPLAPVAVTALRRRREQQIAAGVVPLPTSWVFTRHNGDPVEAKEVARAWPKLLRRAGIPTGLRFHDLRHSTASFLLASGVPPRTVMTFLGHSNIATTMNIYGHTHADLLGDAATTMERILRG